MNHLVVLVASLVSEALRHGEGRLLVLVLDLEQGV